MNIFSDKVKQHEEKSSEIQRVISEFSSDDTNKEFIIRFREVLLELSKAPMESPNALVANIDPILNKI